MVCRTQFNLCWFYKTLSNLDSFYLLIEKQYLHKSLLQSIDSNEKFLRNLIDIVENKIDTPEKLTDLERIEKRTVNRFN